MQTEKNFAKFADNVEKEIAYWKQKTGGIMQALRAIQESEGYISSKAMIRISKEFNTPLSTIYGIVTFYHYFKLRKPGIHKIRVCLGTACYIKGAGNIMETLEKLLNIKENETTQDGMFTLEGVRCLGCCGLAPVMTIDDKVYGNLTPTEACKIVEKWMRGENK